MTMILKGGGENLFFSMGLSFLFQVAGTCSNRVSNAEYLYGRGGNSPGCERAFG